VWLLLRLSDLKRLEVVHEASALHPPGMKLRLTHSRFLRNTAGLYLAMAATYVGPLVTLAYVARVLGHTAWGQLAFAQAFAAIVSAFVSYGFNLTGVRDVARFKNHSEAVGRVMADISVGRLVLSAIALIVSGLAWKLAPTIHGIGVLIWLSVASGVVQANSLLWLYQGLQAVRLPVTLEVAARVASVGLIVAFVHRPADAWRVPAIQALTFACAVGFEYAEAIRSFGLKLAPLKRVPMVLRHAFGLFVFLVCSVVATQGTFFIGLLAAAPAVALFAGAERIARGATSLTFPVTQAVFARLSSSVVADSRRAAIESVRLLCLTLILGGGISLTTYMFAPEAVQIVLGPTYSGAIVALRVMALMPILSAVSNGFGLQLLAPHGYDRALGVILLAAVGVIGGLAYLLVPVLGVNGMAVAEVAMESFVAIAIFAAASKLRLLPWQRTWS
jgi:O-antigen/teichoic acid export membrane protein